MKFACRIVVALFMAGAILAALPAASQTTLRMAMTAADIPTTTGMPNNGFEGLTFTGYPVFEPLVAWDLRQGAEAGKIMPGLATEWSSDPADRSRWIFKLRRNVKFHDGTALDADAVIWNLERFYNDKSPQFEPNGSAIVRGRAPLKSWEKIDDSTVAILTPSPTSYFPWQAPYILIASPAAFEKAGRSWVETAKAPAGTGPFKLTKIVPRASAELAKNDAYWDASRMAHVNRIVLYPMPDPMTRVSALRGGQVDYIVAPPPDTLASLKAAGLKVEMKGEAPSLWTYMLMTESGSPFADRRIRQAANYAVDREALVKLLNNTAVSVTSYWSKSDPNYGHPKSAYAYDPAKSLALIKEAGLTPPVKATVLIPNSGSGMMLPLPMNESIQQDMAKAGFDVQFKVVEYGELLVVVRQPATAVQNRGLDGLNVSVTTDLAATYRWFPSSAATPVGVNWGQWKNAEVDALMREIAVEFDPTKLGANLQRLHEIVVDEAPWLFIARDLQPIAMSPKVAGHVAVPSFFTDLTTLSVK